MFRLDHIVLLVRDLAAAALDFGGLGFQVAYGGEHESGGTHNAIIPFADGTYLELLSYKRATSVVAAPEDRIPGWRFLGQGLVDFALVPGDLDVALQRARARGLDLTGPIPGGRARPDGLCIAWRLGLAATLDLPFLCADVTPRALRIPEGAAANHENGVLGVERVVVGVDDLAASVQRYRALLGTEPDTSGRTFVLGHSRVTLEPVYRRQGLLEVELRAAAPGKCGPLPARLAHGAAITIVAS